MTPEPDPEPTVSSNRLAYGPGEWNGMTFTVAEDGGLHVAGEVTGWKTVYFECDADGLAGQTVTYAINDLPTRFDSYMTLFTPDGRKVNKIGTFNCPENLSALRWNFRHATTSTTPDTIDVTVYPRLTVGDTAAEWEKPDRLDAPGGGDVMANLFPAITTIWRSDNGIAYAIVDDGAAFTAAGTIGEKRDYSLVPLATVTLDAGTYTLAGTQFDGNGFTAASAVQLTGPGTTGDKASSAKESFTVTGGSYTAQFVTRDPTIDGTITPALYKID